VATSELTWGLIIAAARGLARAERNMRSGGWHDALAPGMMLSGKRLGVLGLGKMGSYVARLGKAFGMEVAAWSENLTSEKAEAEGADYVSKEDLFSRSDVVSVHLVLSDRTRGIVGAADLARMKPGSILVNVSRGPLIDEKALIEALKKGRPGHAALDVYDREPLPAEHPLRKMENVTLSPHLGYVNEENYRSFYADTVENVAAWLEGKPIRLL
jgi:D-3-phosphoglycerate dehydrogenase